MRTATVDTTLGGVEIAAGDHVLLLYGSADRDEATFGETAGTLDVGRSPNHHVAFGFGAHFCLGAALARLEAQLLLELLLDRVGGIELAGEIVPSPSTVIAGVKRAPLLLRAG
jgi:cytochrome P450